MKISIVIATHERPASLVRLLCSLAPQLTPGRHELFVAENGTPAPAQIEAVGIELTHLHDTRRGKCRIQNRAIVLAAGEIIVFLDDDVVATPDYVAAVERFFDDYPQFAAMKGRILPTEDPLAIAGPMAPYLDLPIVDHGEEVLEVRGVMGANMAYRASALRMAGPFDERLGPGAAGHEEETELSQRMRRTGFRIGYAPRALVLHEVDPARAVRARFIRISRERGYCRTLHEHHSRSEVALKLTIAAIRLTLARAFRASVVRIAREERRLAVAQGMHDGLTRTGK
ncbi:MAG: glycosyltransferase family 2 protein [Deltaproteobacteria bacterium]|nr:glycosyltransferase family 2 protein [Deltaproteobacteria bacterium]